MMGHENQRMGGVYIATYLERIRGKLDSYWGKDSYHDAALRNVINHKLSLSEVLLNSISGNIYELT